MAIGPNILRALQEEQARQRQAAGNRIDLPMVTVAGGETFDVDQLNQIGAGITNVVGAIFPEAQQVHQLTREQLSDLIPRIGQLGEAVANETFQPPRPKNFLQKYVHFMRVAGNPNYMQDLHMGFMARKANTLATIGSTLAGLSAQARLLDPEAAALRGQLTRNVMSQIQTIFSEEQFERSLERFAAQNNLPEEDVRTLRKMGQLKLLNLDDPVPEQLDLVKDITTLVAFGLKPERFGPAVREMAVGIEEDLKAQKRLDEIRENFLINARAAARANQPGALMEQVADLAGSLMRLQAFELQAVRLTRQDVRTKETFTGPQRTVDEPQLSLADVHLSGRDALAAAAALMSQDPEIAKKLEGFNTKNMADVLGLSGGAEPGELSPAAAGELIQEIDQILEQGDGDSGGP